MNVFSIVGIWLENGDRVATVFVAFCSILLTEAKNFSRGEYAAYDFFTSTTGIFHKLSYY